MAIWCRREPQGPSSASRSIADIAAWMGFVEPANFTHAFKRWTGATPSEWLISQKQA